MHPLLVLQAVLLLAGVALIAAGAPLNSRPVVAAGLVLLGFAGVGHLWLATVHRRRFWSLCDIQAGSLLISYFLGAAVTLMLSETGLIQRVAIPELATLLEATVYIIFFAVCLFGFGRIESLAWRRLWPDAQPRAWPGWIAPAIGSLVLFQAYLLANGAITFMGTGVVDGNVPYFASFVIALSWPLAGLAGWIIGHAALRRRPVLLMAALAIVPVQILFSLAHGRRVVLFQALIFLTCFLWARRKGFTLNQVVVIGLIALPVVYALWVMFLAMRIETNLTRLPAAGDRTLLTHMDNAMEMMDRRWSLVTRAQGAEIVDRVYVLGFVVDLMDGAKVANRLDGTGLAYQVVNAVPRVFLRDKQRILASLRADDQKVTQRYGLGPRDRAESIVTAAYTDFRLFGPVIYGALAMLIGFAAAGLARLARTEVFTIYVIAYVFFVALATEQSFVTVGLNMLRILVLPAVGFAAYRLVVGRSTPFVLRGARVREG